MSTIKKCAPFVSTIFRKFRIWMGGRKWTSSSSYKM